MDFSDYATAPKSKSGVKKTQLPESVGKFVAECDKQGFRIDYTGMTLILIEEGAVSEASRQVPTACGRFLDKLPQGHQYVVTRKDGKYSQKALDAWGSAVEPRSKLDNKIILGEKALDLFRTWSEKNAD